MQWGFLPRSLFVCGTNPRSLSLSHACVGQSMDGGSKTPRAVFSDQRPSTCSSEFVSSPSTQLLCSCHPLCSILLVGWMLCTTCRWSGLCDHQEDAGASWLRETQHVTHGVQQQSINDPLLFCSPGNRRFIIWGLVKNRRT